LGISVSTLEDRVAKMCKRKVISVQKNTGSGKHRNNVYTLWSLENPEVYCNPNTVSDDEIPLTIA
jgi:hypothetical protein